MGKFHTSILPAHQAFIEEQQLFFVATSPLSAEGHINCSPKGTDSFRVLGENKAGYMDLIGSGNETAAHILENGRITFMFCAFKGAPNILRLYGTGRSVLPGSKEWEETAPLFTIHPSTRQLIIADIHKVQTSCGFGIPLYSYNGERTQHFDWAGKKGMEGLEEYKEKNNRVSLDGLNTGLIS